MKESIMDEIFPIVMGGIVGWLCWALPAAKRLTAFGFASIVIGVLASYFSGELRESTLFILVDSAEALATAVAASWIRTRLSRSDGKAMAKPVADS
jgi:hypothetical protein